MAMTHVPRVRGEEIDVKRRQTRIILLSALSTPPEWTSKKKRREIMVSKLYTRPGPTRSPGTIIATDLEMLNLGNSGNRRSHLAVLAVNDNPEGSSDAMLSHCMPRG